MLFEYSNHSLEQMQLRNISKEIVDLVMKHPDSVALLMKPITNKYFKKL